jgi:hypothetical protein
LWLAVTILPSNSNLPTLGGEGRLLVTLGWVADTAALCGLSVLIAVAWLFLAWLASEDVVQSSCQHRNTVLLRIV